MSYNGSGTFNINSTGQPVVAGTIISAATFNALTADLATGLTTALTKDGQTTATARIPFAQGISSTLVTDASSVSTGSIITAGGVGIAKKLYVGTDANVAGTLAVTGVATYSAQPIFSSLTASSAVATDASKGLVSVANTGTGSNVLATAPTIASANLTTALTLAGAAGTNGQVLTSAGSGLPSWTTPSSGALVYLSTVTASAAATADIETGFSSTYDNYLIEATSVLTSGNVAVYCRLKIGGSYLTGSTYGYHSATINDFVATYSALQSSSATEIRMMNASSTAPSSFEMSIPDANASAHHAIRYLISSRAGTLTALGGGAGIGHSDTSGALSGIRLFPPSGTISGTFRLYGIANS